MDTTVANEVKAMAKAFQERITVKPVEEPVRSASGNGYELCEPDCPVCGGGGWVRNDVPITHSMFGKLSPCPKSNPFKRYAKILGISLEDRKLSWRNSVVETQGVIRAVHAVKKTLERGYGWVYLWGDYGLAKTLILKVALVEYIQATRQPASYLRMVEILDHLRGAFDADNPSLESQARLDMYAELPLLCIDEFEKVKNTEWASERRFVLMDRRYEQACREKSITLMASNSDPRTLEGYLADRIFDGRFEVVQLTGKSLRPAMRYKVEQDA
jgi:hypothetical protein